MKYEYILKGFLWKRNNENLELNDDKEDLPVESKSNRLRSSSSARICL